MNNQDKVVAIVHYNTQELTAAAIRSLEKCTPGTHIIVFDNSDKTPFDPTGIDADIQIIDNTHGEVIDFDAWLETFSDKLPSKGNNYGSAKHCYTIQWLIDHRRRDFVVMDSDILIAQDISDLWDSRNVWVGQVSCNTKRRFGFEVLKVDPFLCYINVPMVRANRIKYFDPERMWDLVSTPPFCKYDTGAVLYEESKRHRLPTREIDVTDYALHLRHGSWNKKSMKATTEWLEKHRALWDGTPSDTEE